MWSKLGHSKTLAYEPWPTYDERKLVINEIHIGVSINGKVRDTILLSKDATQEEALSVAMSSEKIQKWLEGHQIRKIIYVPGRILNLVVA